MIHNLHNLVIKAHFFPPLSSSLCSIYLPLPTLSAIFPFTYPCLPGVSNSGTTLMPLILAASIICAMFACEYTCVFGLNEPF